MARQGQRERLLRIGEVAERTGLTQRTIRFYEERGLLHPPDRMESGFRLFSEEDIQRLELIKQLQRLLGFTLEEIKGMVEAEEVRLALRAEFPVLPPAERHERVARAIEVSEAQLAVINQKIEQLGKMRAEWEQKLRHYQARLAEAEGNGAARASSRGAVETRT